MQYVLFKFKWKPLFIELSIERINPTFHSTLILSSILASLLVNSIIPIFTKGVFHFVKPAQNLVIRSNNHSTYKL